MCTSLVSAEGERDFLGVSTHRTPIAPLTRRALPLCLHLTLLSSLLQRCLWLRLGWMKSGMVQTFGSQRVTRLPVPSLPVPSSHCCSCSWHVHCDLRHSSVPWTDPLVFPALLVACGPAPSPSFSGVFHTSVTLVSLCCGSSSHSSVMAAAELALCLPFCLYSHLHCSHPLLRLPWYWTNYFGHST